MKSDLPYLIIDEEYDFNVAILILLINGLAINSKNNPKLDLSKIQFYMYLLKNPSKINRVLEAAGKKHTHLDERQTYTIESLAVNVDILYNTAKIKSLLKKASSIGALDVVNDNKSEIYYLLTDKGKKLAEDFKVDYFEVISKHIKSVKPLQSISSSKLFSILNTVFKGDE